MTTESIAKPSYLGLLNAISIGERNAGVYLKAWAQVAQDAGLKRSLSLVAERESTHGEVFRQRIERLGFSLRDKEDPDLERKAAFYGDASVSDVDKIRRGQRSESDQNEGDQLAGLEARINDEMDPLTTATMRWYIAEERDTGTLLKAEYARVLGR